MYVKEETNELYQMRRGFKRTDYRIERKNKFVNLESFFAVDGNALCTSFRHSSFFLRGLISCNRHVPVQSQSPTPHRNLQPSTR